MKSIKEKSNTNYNYQTIKITSSRINKGLLAIPRVFSDFLPKNNQKIKVYLDDTDKLQLKTYSSAYSSTNENRIGGLKKWFNENHLKNGDEVILQAIDKDKFIYRLISERHFTDKTNKLQNLLDGTDSEEKATAIIETISDWIQIDKKQVYLNEYIRISDTKIELPRKKRMSIQHYTNEGTPANIRTLLGTVYSGICQVCSFSFLKKDNNPYYEIHHLEPSLEHHPKNLVLVCANCHRQFEYANLVTEFNSDNWLTNVQFNKEQYKVKQVIFDIKELGFTKIVHL